MNNYTLTKDDDCGKNYISLEKGYIDFKLSGDTNCVLILKEINLIRGNAKYGIPIDKFIAGNGH